MIALDAMGGDYAPAEIVQGAILAAKRGLAIQLFGDQVQMLRCLDQAYPKWERLPITIIHCNDSIGMDEEPTAVLRKEQSSLMQAIKAVKNGKAQAVISAGNTGAALVAGMMALGKVPGIARPAIGEFLPTRSGDVFCIDLGANVDCKVEHLRQFALMGDAYVRLKKNIANPRIGLLCNGAERGKGNRLINEVHEQLRQMPLNFVGNCEPDAVLSGAADVIVCEGFSGNIMLKTCEAMARTLPQWIGQECQKTVLGKCVGTVLPRIMKTVKQRIQEQKGGALLLGVLKPIIIAHGSSNANAISQALQFAHDVVTSEFFVNFNDAIEKIIKHMHGMELSTTPLLDVAV
jgi:glycerol-3-phosphate acyltransferase PlsX